MRLRPWGSIGWLLEKVGRKQWHIVTSSSFEDRCLALVDWLSLNNQLINSATIFCIENPPTSLWHEAKPVVEKNFNILRQNLSGSQLNICNTQLNAQLSINFDDELLGVATTGAVILDITTLPKRFFLFAMKRLVNNPKVTDLVVTYGRAQTYPEIALCEDALPPSALPGFGRIEAADASSRLVVGVGYVALSVEDLLEKARHEKLDYIFPFPPASPAFRRNWALLSRLIPTDYLRTTEIHRIHSMDAFAVFERTLAWGQGRSLDMLPLGPKPHALGMAMAYMRLDGHAELIYSQPQAYRVNYSTGIARDSTGNPEIYAYCLKRDGRLLF